MKNNINSKDVRIHHRICGAQNHLLQGAGNLMEKFVNQGTVVEKVR